MGTAHLIPAVFKSQAWPVLHALLEIIAYRVHLQLQYSYRFQLLQQLHTVVGVTIIPAQLFVRSALSFSLSFSLSSLPPSLPLNDVTFHC